MCLVDSPVTVYFCMYMGDTGTVLSLCISVGTWEIWVQSCHCVFLYVHGRYGYSPVTVYFCVYTGDIWVDGPMYFVCTQEIWVDSPVTVYFYVNTGDMGRQSCHCVFLCKHRR